MSSNDNPAVKLSEKILHHALMGFMALVIIFAGFVAYMSMQKPVAKHSEPPVVENVGQKKPLPDYMIDTIKSDELELLKP